MSDNPPNPRSRRHILEGRDEEIIKTLEAQKGNISATAKVFGVSENAIYHWMDRKGVSIEIKARVIQTQPQPN